MRLEVTSLWQSLVGQYISSTVTLEFVCLIVAVAASFIGEVPAVILAITRGEDKLVVGAVSELLRTRMHRTELLLLNRTIRTVGVVVSG